MSRIPSAAIVEVAIKSMNAAIDELHVDQIKRLLSNLILRSGCCVDSRFGTLLVTQVVAAGSQKSQDVVVTSTTTITIINQLQVEVKQDGGEDMEEDSGELQRLLKEMIGYPKSTRRIGIDAPKGILIHGPPGVGKTYSVMSIAKKWKLEIVL
jgi:transitional endoplasmic reticulum ATPase